MTTGMAIGCTLSISLLQFNPIRFDGLPIILRIGEAENYIPLHGLALAGKRIASQRELFALDILKKQPGVFLVVYGDIFAAARVRSRR